MPRIRVAQIVMDYLFRHSTPEEMVEQYPHLQLAETYAVMAYYFDHKDEIDAQIAAEEAEIAEWRAEAETDLPPVVQRLRDLKRDMNR
jgi:hypothetical protein